MYSLVWLKRFFIGQSLPTHAEHHERLSVPLGLAIFAADALSSSAYATEEILLITVAGGHFGQLMGSALAIPISLAIVLLLTVVVLSYRELIRTYPSGGGAYVVAKENLGVIASLIAGASLLLDYVLTVSVSISAGIAAFTSAFPILYPHRVGLCIAAIVLMTYANIRGLKESARLFAIPVYIFIVALAGMIVMGIVQWLTNPGMVPPVTHPVEAIKGINVWDMAILFILLKAFASGCTALTGIEAISNGVKAFKEPSVARANLTMALLGLILAFLFFGVSTLAYLYHIQPTAQETVVSQIARTVLGGDNWAYYVVQLSTMTILVMAANTSFSGFPRLASFMAEDSWVPRQLGLRGDKLVFTNGILMCGIAAGALVLIFHGETHALIPLYAIGVFISFTLAQAGIFKKYMTERSGNWIVQSALSGVGAVVTGIVMLVIACAKFMAGAWLVIVAMPLIIWQFFIVKRHYKSVQRQLAIPEDTPCPVYQDSTVIVLIASLHRGSIQALSYARSIAKNVEAVHVSLNPYSTQYLKDRWEQWGCGIPLVIIESPYRSLTEPLMNYIEEVEKRYPNDILTVIIPEFVTKKWWHGLLHNQSAMTIKLLLKWNRRAVVTTSRFYLDE